MRVLMVEPHGEGGICHFTYCLANAMQAAGHRIMLATSSDYELQTAHRDFALVQPFGRSSLRRRLQHWRGATNAAPQKREHGYQPLSSAELPDDVPLYATQGVTRKASQWLAGQEMTSGWNHVLHLAESQAFDVIHVQWYEGLLQKSVLLQRLQQQGTRLIMTVHNVLPHEPDMATRDQWTFLYRLMDRLIVLYPKAALDLQAMGIDPARISVIPHGNYLPIVDFATGNVATTQEMARSQLGLAHDTSLILFFGLVRPYKGIEVLIKALAHLHQLHEKVQLLIAGRAPYGFTSLKRQILDLGIGGAIIAMPGYLSLPDVMRCFSASDCVVMPYLADTASGVAHLAYAQQRAIIASRVGVFPDLVLDNVTGMLVPPGDPDALATALTSLLHDRADCHQMGRRGYELARDTYSWGPIAQATQALYRDVATI